ncbi:hypothetical protein H632_c794p0 [Helicosporidium sp. ATCC 50920]|nr:hypothetical protein H632_c794p0 [Helicosporidium sp. ATCC 50920]|eukprot:KDD75233.1 hypothetical protein H632_c794p0 [Helicosporidium sp. ATCC 50920]
MSPNPAAVSTVVILRYLPHMLLAPISGALADRLNRIRICQAACLVSFCAVSVLSFLEGSGALFAVFSCLAVQHTSTAIFFPSRDALVSVVTHPKSLSVALSLDSFLWSITAALGALSGGFVASRFGLRFCFVVDACTYLVAAACFSRLPACLGNPRIGRGAAHRLGFAGDHPDLGPVEVEEAAEEADVDLPSRSRDVRGSGQGGDGAGSSASSSSRLRQVRAGESDAEEACLLSSPRLSGLSVELVAEASAAPRESVFAIVLRAAGEGFRSTLFGLRWLCHPSNRDAAIIACIKPSYGLTWGAVDVMNVRFAELPNMQPMGDVASTLGLLYFAIGAGSISGALLLNPWFPPRPGRLLWGVGLAFGLMSAGYTLLLWSDSVPVLMLSNFVRCTGASTCFIWCTVLLQSRVPNDVLGRVGALQGAAFTAMIAFAAFMAGGGSDYLGVTLHQTAEAVLALSCATTVLWTAYAWYFNRNERQAEAVPALRDYDRLHAQETPSGE